jgi:YidC/Oxa1 family membrane protein insertase
MPILANIIQEAFSPLISLFEAVLVFIHDHAGISWGLAIVGLTVIVRAVMMPATFSQLRSMRKMQLVAPELKALKEKYKDDKQRQQEEMMKLYREKGINPFASCLPLVLQLPVFISLFYMLRTDLKKHICGPSLVSSYNAMHHAAITSVAHLPAKYIEKTSCQSVAPGSAKFLFVPDITAKATGVVLIVLLALYLSSQVVSTLLMSASAEPSQRWMMLGLPLIFVLRRCLPRARGFPRLAAGARQTGEPATMEDQRADRVARRASLRSRASASAASLHPRHARRRNARADADERAVGVGARWAGGLGRAPRRAPRGGGGRPWPGLRGERAGA